MSKNLGLNSGHLPMSSWEAQCCANRDDLKIKSRMNIALRAEALVKQ